MRDQMWNIFLIIYFSLFSLEINEIYIETQKCFHALVFSLPTWYFQILRSKLEFWV